MNPDYMHEILLALSPQFSLRNPFNVRHFNGLVYEFLAFLATCRILRQDLDVSSGMKLFLWGQHDVQALRRALSAS